MAHFWNEENPHCQKLVDIIVASREKLDNAQISIKLDCLVEFLTTVNRNFNLENIFIFILKII